MSQKNHKHARKQRNRKNQEVLQGFMLEISAQPFWQRFVFCMKMAFKRHVIQKSMKAAIVERKRLLKAQKSGGVVKPIKKVTVEKGRAVGSTLVK